MQRMIDWYWHAALIVLLLSLGIQVMTGVFTGIRPMYYFNLAVNMTTLGLVLAGMRLRKRSLAARRVSA